jgi:hypothetical protein
MVERILIARSPGKQGAAVGSGWNCRFLQKSSKNMLRSKGKLLVSVARLTREVTVKISEANLRNADNQSIGPQGP